MPPVISFIGWHNSGKTTLASQVVALLKAKGYTVAVIKSTKEQGLAAEEAWTDTAIYRRAGADCIALLAPDQLLIRSKPPELDLLSLVQRTFFDRDLVIAEGFKHAAQVEKIEVRRDPDSPLLRDQVEGVVAVVTDLFLTGGIVFRFEQSREIADFIESRLLADRTPATPISLTVNGANLPLPEPLRRQLTATVLALLGPLPMNGKEGTLELCLHCRQPPCAADI
ncbi:MAG: molybdopterin-guanine dinucleotide biosynthesis protein B [Desulfobulbaceae bacterium]|nr:molybdopterin-guanine dinucleotide biosynthesis protein B [Desulfobulbaceae bacterium]